jgi:thiamine-phosphate pyrophosphorylase
MTHNNLSHNSRSAARLIDANGNRAAEGLRFLEDTARFLLDDAFLADLAKQHRHAVRAAIPAHAVGARDTAGDIGTTIKANDEMVRARLVDAIRANAARAAEAIRVVEETSKLLGNSAAAAQLEAARYATYRLETGLLSRMPAWRLFQVRLYALIDTALTDDPLRVAVAAVRGGAGAVQLRAKALSVQAYYDLALRMNEAVKNAGGLFIVNDHVAIAQAINADGVHVGQDDLPLSAARQVVGPCCALGISAHTAEQITTGIQNGADYVGLGPMYATTTKPHEPERGPSLLDAAQKILHGTHQRPSFAIGGLDSARISALKSRLPHGVAVAGAICKAADPERVAAELLHILSPDELP